MDAGRPPAVKFTGKGITPAFDRARTRIRHTYAGRRRAYGRGRADGDLSRRWWGKSQLHVTVGGRKWAAESVRSTPARVASPSSLCPCAGDDDDLDRPIFHLISLRFRPRSLRSPARSPGPWSSQPLPQNRVARENASSPCILFAGPLLVVIVASWPLPAGRVILVPWSENS
jgi:hypothetical protein